MTVAKDQHFLPQFYLRQFLDPATPPNQEPYVWLFDLSKRQWRRRAPENFASLRHYYAYRDQEGKLINLIEPTLTGVETSAAKLIHKLKTHQQLTEREQLEFCFFVAQLTVRTPQHRELTRRSLERMGRDVITTLIQHLHENPDKFEAVQRRYQEKTGTNSTLSIDDLMQNPPSLEFNDIGLLAYSLVPCVGLTQRLLGMTWRFYFTADEERLIICDHPGDFAFPEEVAEESFRGFFTKGVEFHVPLTPNLVFTAYDDGVDRAFGGLLGREDITRMNRRMARRAEQFIVSTKPTFLGDEVLASK
jgi:hypothetical protein